MTIEYPAIFTPNDRGYQVAFPDLSDCAAYGADFPSALKNAKAAAAKYVDHIRKTKHSLPSSSHLETLKNQNNRFLALIRIPISASL